MLAIAVVITVTVNPILKNCINEIEYFCFAAALIAATVAADPIIVAFPPSAAPIASDHHN